MGPVHHQKIKKTKNPAKSIGFVWAKINERGWSSTNIQIHQFHEIVACHIFARALIADCCSCQASQRAGLWQYETSCKIFEPSMQLA